MIRINIIGFNDSDSGAPRWGDSQIIDDGKNYVVIDGYCGKGKTKLIERLKDIKCKTPYLYISHAHYDHFDGIRAIINDKYFSPKLLGCYDPDSLSDGFGNSEVKSDAESLRSIINLARSKGIPVKLLKHGDVQTHGDIRFNVYRKQPAYTSNSDDPHGWAFVNDGSLCFWFPQLSYWTSGDGSEKTYDFCKEVGAKPILIKLPHHGNNLPRSQSEGLYAMGCRYCWDNDYSTEITDFLRYGRGRAIEAGMTFLDIHGDINMIFFSKRAVIYKHGNIYRYSCSYKGLPKLKGADLEIIKEVLEGKLGKDDARATALLDRGYNVGIVQREINTLVKLIK